jgi:ketopantoate reductase
MKSAFPSALDHGLTWQMFYPHTARDFRASMLQDVQAGRPLGLEALTGAVREIGTLVGVLAPFTDALHGLSRLAERTRVQVLPI